jgi:hypothetical protein
MVGIHPPTIIASFSNGIRLCAILCFPYDNGVVVATSDQGCLVLVLCESRSKDQAVVRLEGCDTFVVFVEFLLFIRVDHSCSSEELTCTRPDFPPAYMTPPPIVSVCTSPVLAFRLLTSCLVSRSQTLTSPSNRPLYRNVPSRASESIDSPSSLPSSNVHMVEIAPPFAGSVRQIRIRPSPPPETSTSSDGASGKMPLPRSMQYTYP